MRIHHLNKVAALLAVMAMLAVMPAMAVEQGATPVWITATGIDRLDPAADTSNLVPSPLQAEQGKASPRGFSPGQLLTALANQFMDIRYQRGGRKPSTGFDCSGFVRYVFKLGVGVELPNTSAMQYKSGTEVARNDLRSGDLVFFRTRGKRISHVGIYLEDGRFIHAPSSGKRVSVSSLSEPYWSRRYAGGRRPQVLAGHEMMATPNQS
ncbi:C40 family peptidase [Dokdonella sp.]|uniref:C40 family peptidase n=1 Tax=Dokdonella sp. TaxID=2291710 RepID=UPI003C5351CC